jgi:RNAse (barnase) inhibitor barstar
MNETPKLVIDVGSVRTRDELHALLAQKLAFPDYYGMNWDAFDERIRDYPPQGTVLVTGFLNLENALPREATQMRNCLGAFEAELPQSRKVEFR